MVCAKCGARDNKIDVRPNWNDEPTRPSLTGKVALMTSWRVDFAIVRVKWIVYNR